MRIWFLILQKGESLLMNLSSVSLETSSSVGVDFGSLSFSLLFSTIFFLSEAEGIVRFLNSIASQFPLSCANDVIYRDMLEIFPSSLFIDSSCFSFNELCNMLTVKNSVCFVSIN